MSTLSPKRAVAGFDSATAMMRAVSSALRNKRFTTVGQGRLVGAQLRLANLLPEALRTEVYRLSGAAEGVPPGLLGSIDMQQVAAWVTAHYDAVPPQFPGVVIGSSNGAMAHLCAVAGIP